MSEYVIKQRAATLGRIEKFTSDVFYTRTNLRGRLYLDTKPVPLSHRPVSGRPTYEIATDGEFITVPQLPFSVGPTWSTHWFKAEVNVPQEWLGKEVRLNFDCDCEAMLWIDGKPVQGLSGGYPANQTRRDYVISEKLTAQETKQEIYVELACNNMKGAGKTDFIRAPDRERNFSVSAVVLVLFNRPAYDLLLDFDILLQIAQTLPANGHRSNQALLTANEMINVIDVMETSTYIKARDLAKIFLEERTGHGQMTLHAMGHCHIDCAWLWPYAETIRKCARSWTNTIQLLKKYPEMTFTCSQAQQFQWVKDHYPSLYAEIKEMVKQGRFIPVGGSWVEMDGNLPSGESFVRQILYGQKFFETEFGIQCKEFWLPDTFGYSGQLPQIVKSGGMSRFITQKISWCVNKFPHHTFNWEGIDGSTILTHFPPGDSYHMFCTVDEMVKTSDNCMDKGRSRNACYLYGLGDGGGGPTELMLERLRRLENTDGLPRLVHSTMDTFFDAVASQDKNLCRWVGELYLEFHQGTYTSQAKTKLGNRTCEILLHDIDVVASLAQAEHGCGYPRKQLEEMWKKVLLNQFHDVLPGSSIKEVYDDALKIYEDVKAEGQRLLKLALLNLAQTEDGGSAVLIVNTLPWDRFEVVELPADVTVSPGTSQTTHDGKQLVYTSVPSTGFSMVQMFPCFRLMPLVIEEEGNYIQMENSNLSAKLDKTGRLISLIHKQTNRNLVEPEKLGNQFVIFDDMPVYWDAWDVNHYHLETRKLVDDVISSLEIIETGPLRVSVQVTLRISSRSTIKQTISLDQGLDYLRFQTEVDWNEDHKFLKVEFPWNIRAQAATYEIQYGHVQRPTHYNTEWDWMKFEVCGQRWADLSQHGSGVAVLNNSKYGYSTHGNVMRISLLKSSRSPDETADIGIHTFTYGLMPHAGSFQEAGVHRSASTMNSPLVIQGVDKKEMEDTPCKTKSFFQIDNPAVILDSIKVSESDDEHLIIRLYEAFGSSATATITSLLIFSNVMECDILERDIGPVAMEKGCPSFTVNFEPFQLKSLKLKLK